MNEFVHVKNRDLIWERILHIFSIGFGKGHSLFFLFGMRIVKNFSSLRWNTEKKYCGSVLPKNARNKFTFANSLFSSTFYHPFCSHQSSHSLSHPCFGTHIHGRGIDFLVRNKRI